MSKIAAGILALLLPIQAMAAAPPEEPITASELEQYVVPVTDEAFEPNFESQKDLGPFQNRALDDIRVSPLLHLLLLVGNGRISPVRIHPCNSMAGPEASVD